jgi:hypothetical protein
MATEYAEITDEQAELIRSAPLFIVASADPSLEVRPNVAGPVNLSPKGGVPLHILDRGHVAYLDYEGSGDETARAAALDGPVTIMICSFGESDAGVIRLFGKAKTSSVEESPLANQLLGSTADDIALPLRQISEVEIASTQTSCGYGVPIMEYVRERTTSDRGRKFKPGRSRQR